MTIIFLLRSLFYFFCTNRFNVDLAADVPLRFNTCLTFCPEAMSFIASRPCSFTLFRPALAMGFKIGITVLMALLKIEPKP